MPTKEKLINYFMSNQLLSGNIIYFNDMPAKKNQKKKSQLDKPVYNIEVDVPSAPLPINEITSTSVQPIANLKQNSVNIPLRDLAHISSLEQLHDNILECQCCTLGSTRNKLVFGSGNPNADIMVIGEAPGADEDAQGLPFVGRAGQLLTDILKSVNFSREEVYIANICKCRPPANRKPTTEEIYFCENYLKKQIELIKPQFILALGLTAADALFKKTHKMAEVRGKKFDYHGIQTIITYHPAALLRNPSWKRSVWEDIQYLRRLYDNHLSTV